MKNYLLLRDNVQSGPYASEALRRLPLRPLDLVWVEGESTRWYSVNEIPELKSYVVETPRAARPVRSIERTAPLPEEFAVTPPPFPEKPRRQPRRFRFRPSQREAAGGAWILGLFACLIGGAVVVKKIMDGPEVQTLRPVRMAAQPLPEFGEEQSAKKPADLDYHNALKTETVHTDTSAPVSQLSLSELRKQITIGTNRRRQEIFGGIHDLQVTVHNGTAQVLRKVNLMVEFVRPNGEKLRQEQYSVYELQPNSNKILVVPPTKQGLKVRYKLVGVETGGAREVATA